MRHVLRIAALCLGFAAAASAQWEADAVCVDPGAVAEAFDPNFAGLPVETCQKLCKTTANVCRKHVKEGCACAGKSFNAIYDLFQVTDCDPLEDPNARKACRTDVKQAKQDLKANVASLLEESLSDCDELEAGCSGNCSPP
jgi:hypothetical protein